jgi:hypothetical protein
MEGSPRDRYPFRSGATRSARNGQRRTAGRDSAVAPPKGRRAGYPARAEKAEHGFAWWSASASVVTLCGCVAVRPPRYPRSPSSLDRRAIARSDRQTRARSDRRRVTRNGHKLAYMCPAATRCRYLRYGRGTYMGSRARARDPRTSRNSRQTSPFVCNCRTRPKILAQSPRRASSTARATSPA